MTRPSSCPRCHAEVPAGATLEDGCCPRCLLLLGMEGDGGPDDGRPGWSLAGARLGPYEVRELLGAGGMGRVYSALDTRLGRTVALKVLPPEVAADPERLARFRREARALAAVSHPAIVTIHAIEEAEGIHFLAMERVVGRTLGELIPADGMPLDRFLAVALPLAEALAAAHDLGIVHRDLKPGNVMVERGGRVKLLDFGLALHDRRAGGELAPGDPSRTRQGLVLGTLPYLAPEQVQGHRADARADQFALGVLLFEMATGVRPFVGATAPDLFAAILRDDPPRVRDLRPDLPAGLDELIARCLAKDPARRHAGTGEVVEGLRGLTSAGFVAGAESVAAARDSSGPPAPPTASPLPPATPPAATTASGPPPAAAPAPLPAHEIRFCTAPDGVRLAYATAGDGPPLVKTANWLNHLEYDWQSPIWRHWLGALTRGHRLVRYDERGNGLSDWDAAELSLDAFVRDLEAVVDALGLERFPLLAISQGCAVAVAYAVRHPERVSRLVLYGGFARGWAHGGEESRQWGEAFRTLIRQGWGRRHPALRQALVPLFAPDASPEQAAWFGELHRVSTTPQNAVRLWDAFGALDVVADLSRVAVPTLVVHCRDDALVSFKLGAQLASAIPGARFLPLDSRNHLLLADEPAWQRLLPELTAFLAEDGGP